MSCTNLSRFSGVESILLTSLVLVIDQPVREIVERETLAFSQRSLLQRRGFYYTRVSVQFLPYSVGEKVGSLHRFSHLVS